MVEESPMVHDYFSGRGSKMTVGLPLRLWPASVCSFIFRSKRSFFLERDSVSGCSDFFMNTSEAILNLSKLVLLFKIWETKTYSKIFYYKKFYLRQKNYE